MTLEDNCLGSESNLNDSGWQLFGTESNLNDWMATDFAQRVTYYAGWQVFSLRK